MTLPSFLPRGCLRLLRALPLLLSVAACGQTGPLHLPADAPGKEGYLLVKRRGDQPAPPTSPATAPAAPAADPVPGDAPSSIAIPDTTPQ